MKSIVRLCTVVLVFLSSTSVAPAAPLSPENLAASVKGKSLDQIKDLIAKLPREQQALAMSAIRIDPRIVGGNAVDIKDYGWQVALIRGYAPEPMRSQFCGGTLVGPDTVLTAAHCVDNSIVRKDATRIDVIAGTAFYQAGGERLHVSGIVIHPQWNATTNDYDFALLKLASASTLGKPIPLQATPPALGTKADVSGWGALSEGGSGSPDLLAAEVPVVDTGDCNKKDSYDNMITPQMLCAGERGGGVDSCQGDSGGPLVAENTKELIGVVSFGEGCARALKYGVYARVTSAIPWIRSLGQKGVVVADGSVHRQGLFGPLAQR